MRFCDNCGKLYDEKSFFLKLKQDKDGKVEAMEGLYQSGLCRACAKEDKYVVEIVEVLPH